MYLSDTPTAQWALVRFKWVWMTPSELRMGFIEVLPNPNKCYRSLNESNAVLMSRNKFELAFTEPEYIHLNSAKVLRTPVCIQLRSKSHFEWDKLTWDFIQYLLPFSCWQKISVEWEMSSNATAGYDLLWLQGRWTFEWRMQCSCCIDFLRSNFVWQGYTKYMSKKAR